MVTGTNVGKVGSLIIRDWNLSADKKGHCVHSEHETSNQSWLMLSKRRRRWTDIKATLAQRLVSAVLVERHSYFTIIILEGYYPCSHRQLTWTPHIIVWGTVEQILLTTWIKGSFQVKKIKNPRKNRTSQKSPTHSLFNLVFQTCTKTPRNTKNPRWGLTHPPTSKFFCDI